MAEQYDTIIETPDELNSAVPSVQLLAYVLILNPFNWTIPSKNVVIIAAGNPETDKGVTYPHAARLRIPSIHFELRVDFTDWLNWAVNNNIDPDVVGYLSFAKGDLCF